MKKNGWERNGPLIDVLVELSMVIKSGPQPGNESGLWRLRAENALRHAREAYRLLDAARLKAIKEESKHA